MSCCCACKSPLALLAVVGILAGVGFTAFAGPDDKKTNPPKAPTPAAPAEHGKKDEPKMPEVKPADAKPTQPASDAYVLGFTMNRIDGTSDDLSGYKGKVVLIVNVASQCGYTKQYAGLQKLYDDKKDRGFVILGFPANDFKKQEPGTNAEIKEFCTSKYGVTFPMFEKIVVTGDNVAPLYKKIAAQPSPIGGEPRWNFTKFLVDRSGKVVARYEPGIKPDDKVLVQKIDELLNAKQADASSQPKSH
jgi:glutathione peroxidase